MKKVVLKFPDTSHITDFILQHKVSNAEVNSIEQTLVAIMTDEQIVIAETEYGAILKSLIAKN